MSHHSKTKHSHSQTAEANKPASKEKVHKDCRREWVKSPITDRWIEVEGKTWKMLYSKHKSYLDEAERRTTPGKLKNGICVVPVGDPPHGGGGGHGGGHGGGGHGGGGPHGGGGSHGGFGGHERFGGGHDHGGRGGYGFPGYREGGFYRGGQWRGGLWYGPGIGIGLPYPAYDPYWLGPPCYGNRWCWSQQGYGYNSLIWL